MDYNSEIQYKQGKIHTVPDTLSRVQSSEIFLHVLSTVSTDMLDRIKATWQQDLQLQALMHSLQQGKSTNPYLWTNDQLLRKGKLVLGNDPELRSSLLQHFHSSACGNQ